MHAAVLRSSWTTYPLLEEIKRFLAVIWEGVKRFGTWFFETLEVTERYAPYYLFLYHRNY